jgi:hypothetical protein
VLDVLTSAATGAAAGALGGAATAVGSHIGAVTPEPEASTVSEGQQENDSPETDESTNAAAG